jgi:predicted RNA-binding Zn-ribbon protein involved in translation (DUF1610 family)
MGDYKYVKSYRARQKAKGLCPSCGEKAVEGRTNCAYHAKQCIDASWRFWQRNGAIMRERNRIASISKRLKRKDEGRCTRCGMPLWPDVDAGRVKCINCREELCS